VQSSQWRPFFTLFKLLKLNVEKTRMALGIAANFACGLSANHGSMAGAMSAGNACRNGVIAALMAHAVITANPNIIEAKNGFYDTLVGAGHYNAERMADGFGKPYYIESPGIGLKKYPSCYHTHRALDGVFLPTSGRASPQRQGHRRS